MASDLLPPASNSLSINSNSISLNPTSYFNEAATTSSRFSANLTAACDNDSTSSDDNTIHCHPAADESQCETESNFGSSCSRSSSNEIEESCLLGIDCNEKTTVGLVLRVLADTAIRLDGDGWVKLIERWCRWRRWISTRNQFIDLIFSSYSSADSA